MMSRLQKYDLRMNLVSSFLIDVVHEHCKEKPGFILSLIGTADKDNMSLILGPHPAVAPSNDAVVIQHGEFRRKQGKRSGRIGIRKYRFETFKVQYSL